MMALSKFVHEATKCDFQRLGRRLGCCLTGLAGVLSVGMSACSGPLTSAQRAELSTVRIAPPVIAAQSYSKPTGVSKSGRSADDVGVDTGLAMMEAGADLAVYGDSLGLGLIGVPVALAGGVVAATSWTAGQISDDQEEHQFQQQHQAYLSRLNHQVRFPPLLLVKENRAVIANNRFFSARIRSQSPNAFHCELKHYQLEKVGRNEQQQDVLRASLEIDISLVTGSGKTLFDKQYAGVSTSSYTVYQLINQRKSVERVYAEAVGQAMSDFEKDLAAITQE